MTDTIDTKTSSAKEATKRKTLTLKQENFARLVAEGVHQREAYVTSYNTSASAHSTTVVTNSSKVANNPKVKARIAEIRSELELAKRATETRVVHGAALKSGKLDSEYVLEKLRDEAESTRGTPTSRIRALELIGKANGMFSDDINLNVREEKSSDEIADELKSVIAALKGTDRAPKGSAGDKELEALLAVATKKAVYDPEAAN